MASWYEFVFKRVATEERATAGSYGSTKYTAERAARQKLERMGIPQKCYFVESVEKRKQPRPKVTEG